MRPVKRYLLWLILAALVSISFRLAEDSLSFHLRFHWPPEWRDQQGSGYKSCQGPNQFNKGVFIRGSIYQIIPLINGVRPDRTLRPVRLSFQYVAPNGGAWIGLIGDATASPELDLSSTTKLSFPNVPDSNGLFRTPLPAAATWTPITVVAARRTNNPQMTIVLGGTDNGWDAAFSDVYATYPDHDDELVANGDFRESWPLWEPYPEWLGAMAQPGLPPGLLGWAPARLVALIALIALGIAWMRTRQDDPARGAAARDIAWIALSSLVVLGSAGVPDLISVVVDNFPLGGWGWVLKGLAWPLQMAVFVGLGLLGRHIAGRLPSVWGILIIPPLSALCMTATIGMPEVAGKPLPIRDMTIFEPQHWIWLVASAAALCIGVLWADRASHKPLTTSH